MEPASNHMETYSNGINDWKHKRLQGISGDMQMISLRFPCRKIVLTLNICLKQTILRSVQNCHFGNRNKDIFIIDSVFLVKSLGNMMSFESIQRFVRVGLNRTHQLDIY